MTTFIPKGTYEQQRRDRLSDIVGDYLTCEKTEARACYEEILSEVDGWIEYHKKFLDKAVNLKELLLGHRPIDLSNINNKEFLQETIPERY